MKFLVLSMALAFSAANAQTYTIGIDPAPMNQGELGKFIQSEIAHWARLVKLANIQPE